MQAPDATLFSRADERFASQTLAADCAGGLASELITASEIEMAKRGTKVAELHCIVANDGARRLYERMSWQHCGEIQKQVSGSHGLVRVAFWRMTTQLAVPDRQWRP